MRGVVAVFIAQIVCFLGGLGHAPVARTRAAFFQCGGMLLGREAATP